MKRTSLSIAILSAAGFAAVAPAQTPDDAQELEIVGLAEVVVSAQRRTESQQNVPIAISAFAPAELEARGISNSLELAQFVPNMLANSNTGLGSANSFYIRGLGNTETIPTFDPPVGVYVDDVYLSRQNANNLSMFNVKRIEVLRGPQGTLFGRNTTGGAISIVMQEPQYSEFEGFAEVGFGDYNKRLARGSVNIPLTPTFAASISGYWQEDDGYVRNTTTGQRLNDDDGWGARLALRAELGERANWSGSYSRVEANGENLVNFECNPANTNECNGRYATTGMIAGGPSASSPFASLDIHGRKANYRLGNYTQTDLLVSKFSIDVMENATLDLITGYVETAQQYGLDFYDGRGGPSLANPFPTVTGFETGGFVLLNDSTAEQFSQEIKLNGSLFGGTIDYVAGIFYIKEDVESDFADLFSPSSTTTLVLADRFLENGTEAYAGYLQADYNVTDEVKLTAGIRYTDEEKTIGFHDYRAQCNTGTLLPTCLDTSNLVSANGTDIPTSQRTKLWTPRLAVNYKPADDLLLFASATKGFRSGGWNARATAPSLALPFGPEKAWSYELGLKSELLDRRLRANVTFFLLDVSDLQVPSSLVAPNGTTSFTTRNFADYENRGVEVELQYMPIDRLNLYLNAGYQDDKYKIARGGPEFDLYGTRSVAAQQPLCLDLIAAGNVPGGTGTTAVCAAGIVAPDGSIAEPVRTPEFSASFGGTYEIPLGEVSLVPSLNASWHSDQEIQTSNFTIYEGASSGTNGTFPANPYGGKVVTGSFDDEVWFINASLALRDIDDAWQVTAGCTNCFDAVSSTGVLAYTYLTPPRMWTVRARYRF